GVGALAGRDRQDRSQSAQLGQVCQPRVRREAHVPPQHALLALGETGLAVAGPGAGPLARTGAGAAPRAGTALALARPEAVGELAADVLVQVGERPCRLALALLDVPRRSRVELLLELPLWDRVERGAAGAVIEAGLRQLRVLGRLLERAAAETLAVTDAGLAAATAAEVEADRLDRHVQGGLVEERNQVDSDEDQSTDGQGVE